MDFILKILAWLFGAFLMLGLLSILFYFVGRCIQEIYEIIKILFPRSKKSR